MTKDARFSLLQDGPCKLFIGQLWRDVTRDEVTNLLLPYNADDVRLMWMKRTHGAIVSFENTESADRTIMSLHGMNVGTPGENRFLQVSYSCNSACISLFGVCHSAWVATSHPWSNLSPHLITSTNGMLGVQWKPQRLELSQLIPYRSPPAPIGAE